MIRNRLDSDSWKIESVLPPDLDQIVLPDQNLKFAIESLQQSTAMIEKHTKVLEAQRDALEAFRSQKSSSLHYDQSPRRTLGDEMSKANFTV